MFVPPLADRLPEALGDFEQFLHEEPSLPILVRCSLLHYQFETIHLERAGIVVPVPGTRPALHVAMEGLDVLQRDDEES